MSENGDKFVQNMKFESMKGSLDAREQTELNLLSELQLLFAEIDAQIPKLPPLAGEAITEEQRAVQTSIKEKFTEFNRIGRLFLYEQAEVTDTNKFDVTFDLSSNRNASIRALLEAGKMTEEEVMAWHDRNAARSEKFAEFYQRWAEIMETHGEQLYRL